MNDDSNDERPYIPTDVREEVYDEEERQRQMKHTCGLCHGFLGPGSPCAIE